MDGDTEDETIDAGTPRISTRLGVEGWKRARDTVDARVRDALDVVFREQRARVLRLGRKRSADATRDADSGDRHGQPEDECRGQPVSGLCAMRMT